MTSDPDFHGVRFSVFDLFIVLLRRLRFRRVWGEVRLVLLEISNFALFSGLVFLTFSSLFLPTLASARDFSDLEKLFQIIVFLDLYAEEKDW